MSKKILELVSADDIEVRIKKGSTLLFEDKTIVGFIQAVVSPFGNSAKINFTKKYAHKKVYVVVCK
jgi:putative transposon-encoded protein